MLNCHKIIYDESEGYKIFIFFFYSCKVVKLNKVSGTPFLCLLLSVLLPDNDGEEADREHSSYSSEQNFILLHASDFLSNLYLN